MYFDVGNDLTPLAIVPCVAFARLPVATELTEMLAPITQPVTSAWAPPLALYTYGVGLISDHNAGLAASASSPFSGVPASAAVGSTFKPRPPYPPFTGPLPLLMSACVRGMKLALNVLQSGTFSSQANASHYSAAHTSRDMAVHETAMHNSRELC